jgi:hypothetical protein
VSQIICSLAAFVQANFLQAAVDYKKKIGFNGNSVLFLYDTCSNVLNFGIVHCLLLCRFGERTKILLFQEHC